MPAPLQERTGGEAWVESDTLSVMRGNVLVKAGECRDYTSLTHRRCSMHRMRNENKWRQI